MTASADDDEPARALTRLLFRVAYARARSCYCYGCICLTADERACAHRIFSLARAWGRYLRREGQKTAAVPV